MTRIAGPRYRTSDAMRVLAPVSYWIFIYVKTHSVLPKSPSWSVGLLLVLISVMSRSKSGIRTLVDSPLPWCLPLSRILFLERTSPFSPQHFPSSASSKHQNLHRRRVFLLDIQTRASQHIERRQHSEDFFLFASSADPTAPSSSHIKIRLHHAFNIARLKSHPPLEPLDG